MPSARVGLSWVRMSCTERRLENSPRRCGPLSQARSMVVKAAGWRRRLGRARALQQERRVHVAEAAGIQRPVDLLGGLLQAVVVVDVAGVDSCGAQQPRPGACQAGNRDQSWRCAVRASQAGRFAMGYETPYGDSRNSAHGPPQRPRALPTGRQPPIARVAATPTRRAGANDAAAGKRPGRTEPKMIFRSARREPLDARREGQRRWPPGPAIGVEGVDPLEADLRMTSRTQSSLVSEPRRSAANACPRRSPRPYASPLGRAGWQASPAQFIGHLGGADSEHLDDASQ